MNTTRTQQFIFFVSLIYIFFFVTSSYSNTLTPQLKLALQTQKNNPQQAISLYENYLSQEISLNEKITTHILLAKLYSNLSQLSQALEQYNTVISLDPLNGMAYLNKAKLLKKSLNAENVFETIEAFNKCISLGISSAPIFYSLGDCYKFLLQQENDNQIKKNEYYQLAKHNYQQAQKTHPDYIDSLGDLADIEYEMGYYQNALDIYEILARSAPHNYKIQMRMGHAHDQLNQSVRAIDMLRQAQYNFNQLKKSNKDQDNPELFCLECDIHLYLAQAYVKADMIDLANVELQLLLGKTNDDIKPTFHPSTKKQRVQAQALFDQINP